MTESRKQKSRKQARAKIARLTRKDQVAALELSILVLQQQLNKLNVEEFEEGFAETLEFFFMKGQKVRVIGGHRRKGELCEVTDVRAKCVWVKAYDGAIFLKRKNHVVVESQAHMLKREDE